MYQVVKVFIIILVAAVGYCSSNFYEESITFTAYNNLTGNAFRSTFNESLIEQGCDVEGKFAIVTHGWIESNETAWTVDLIANLLYYRGGCVIFMDYYDFPNISAVLLKKIRQLEDSGVNDDDLFMYGFSFGARLVIDAGVNFGINRIKQIDVCEPAGPGFDYYNYLIPKLPTLAAKNVQCIHTTSNYGTYNYNCHQNWRMGYCGWYQVGALPYPNGAHGLCNQYYNSAFTNKFRENNYYNCVPTKLATQFPSNFSMGYMEQRRNSSIVGEIFSVTAVKKPWTVINQVIYN